MGFFRQFISPKYLNLKNGFCFLGVLAIFLMGYFFRAYYFLFTHLPFSAYDLYFEASLFGPKAAFSLLDLFSAKVLSYPLGYYLTQISRHYLQHFYIVYILGGIIFYFLGKELTEQKMGGLLTFAAFALSYENLIQYTGLTYPSGICYLAFATALLFYLKYLKTQKGIHLSLFLIFGLTTITTYHTGAGAFVLTLIGLLVSQLLSSKPVDKKFLASLLFLFGFFCFWLLFFDNREILLLANAVQSLTRLSLIKLASLLVLFPLLFLISLIKLKERPLIIIALVFSAALVFLPLEFFNFLLAWGPENYFASTPTINAVLAQIILLHLYFVLLSPKIIFSQDRTWQFIRGWLVGLFLIFVFLSLEKYYVRILDYSFPLAFVLFAFYWTNSGRNQKFKIPIIVGTLAILTISQFVIFKDDFSLRRFYTQSEVLAGQKIVDLDLEGVFVSDLRTAALFNYLGQSGVLFFDNESIEHQLLFYEPQNIRLYNFDLYRPKTNRQPPNFYVILSKSMEKVVYSTNFQTKPIDSKLFSLYEAHYPKVYDDNLFKIFLIHSPK